MRRFLTPSSHPTAVLILVMALSALVLAWQTFGLINLAMANVDFLAMHRLLAVQEGGLYQLAVLILRGMLALLAYLVFKLCEAEVISRWRGPRV